MYQLGTHSRADFPIFSHNVRKCADGVERPLCYIDSAVSTHKPKRVIDALVAFLSNDYGSVHRGAYQLSVIASDAYESARARVAKFIGSSVASEQIVFTRGTTESLNILAHGLAQTRLN